ncbi:MAG: hypothetical protein ACRDJW_12890 [Thermomicrobiales bacterium]
MGAGRERCQRSAVDRITGIAEEIGKPADGGRWGEATLALTLVEG